MQFGDWSSDVCSSDLHTLVVPKRHVADIFEYDPELAGEVFSRVPKIAQALEKALDRKSVV